jgi:hypothetical protein
MSYNYSYDVRLNLKNATVEFTPELTSQLISEFLSSKRPENFNDDDLDDWSKFFTGLIEDDMPNLKYTDAHYFYEWDSTDYQVQDFINFLQDKNLIGNIKAIIQYQGEESGDERVITLHGHKNTEKTYSKDELFDLLLGKGKIIDHGDNTYTLKKKKKK